MKNGNFDRSSLHKISKYMSTKIKTQTDAILHFIQKMDIEMLEEILDPNCKSDFFDKERLIHELGNIFLKCRNNGDEFLILEMGVCSNKCCEGYQCSVYRFSGNNSGSRLQLRIKEEHGIVLDIRDCIQMNLTKKSKLKSSGSQLFIHRSNDILHLLSFSKGKKD